MPELAETKWSALILSLSAVADASILPLPVTTYFVFLIVLNNKVNYKYLIHVIIGTVTGAVAGYLIGHFAWMKANGEHTEIVSFLFDNIPGFSIASYEKIHLLFVKYNVWILCAATVTPLPYGMFSISSGVFDLNIISFILVTLLSQSIKFTFLTLFITSIKPKLKMLRKSDWRRVALIAATIIIIAVIFSNLRK
jgi:membrane protein YqaA with SNARE-associated domain